MESQVIEQRKDIEYLKLLFALFLTEREIEHMKNLAKDQFIIEPKYVFRQELRRLRALGLIEGLDAHKGIGTLRADSSHDVKNHFRLTRRGLRFLEMHERIERELGPIQL
jgi:hypothetical protein